jgi:hypothetical protein
MLRDAMVELAGNAANGGLVANVRRAEPARRHPAQVVAELGDDRRLAHARRLHRRRHPARRRPIDAQVRLNDLGSLESYQR